MAKVRVKLNAAGFGEILNSARVRAHLAAKADVAAARARATAPVETGEYRNSIRRVSATTDRAVERVASDAPHALVVESRTGNLARAIGGL